MSEVERSGSQKVSISLDAEVLERLDTYAAELGLSRSRLISFMVMQIDQVVRVGHKKDEAGPSGDD